MREAAGTTVHEVVASQARAAVEIEADRPRAAEHLATTILELAAALAADVELTRARETSAAAAAEIDATSAAEFRATAAVAAQAGNVALPTTATSAIASRPPSYAGCP